LTRTLAPSRYRAVDLVGLWSLVIAQPVYDVLRQNSEFFVAHRAAPVDLVLLAGMLSFALPGSVALLIRGVSAISMPAGRMLHVAVVGALGGALASQVLARVPSLGLTLHIAAMAVAGLAAGWMYVRAAPVRLAASILGLLAPVSAAVFLLHPDLKPITQPADPSSDSAVPVPAGAPPIVLVVFDQLPVSSLMRPDGTLDVSRYPGFAALSETTTWFRNATANAELTAWAVPALLSGNLPRRGLLPIVAHHPQNVFTVLGNTYQMRVTEPITQLCPERLCPDAARPRGQRMVAMLLDVGVVSLHVVAPHDLRGRLPSLANGWKDFLSSQNWHWRWVRQRAADRREAPARFIESIRSSDPQPTLYFLHTLLPHEPFVYTRTGQQFTRETALPGLDRIDRWIQAEWPVVQAYQRHLLQVEYADALVERLVNRLKSVGLFDRVLLVITADHGASFRPGRSFRGIDSVTLPDIAGVPLFIKEPHQRSGRVDDRNVQAIDLLPTLASKLHVRLRAAVDGADIDGARLPGRKVVRHIGATREMQIATDALAAAQIQSVERRWRLFDGTVAPVPAGAPRSLLGAPPAMTSGVAAPPMQVLLRDPHLLRNVDLSAPVLPLALEGRLLDREGRPASSMLAIAVNGTVRAVTRTLDRLEPGTWRAQLEPGVLRAGRNDVKVFVLSNDGEHLQLAYPATQRPSALDLGSERAATFWSVRQTGLSTLQSAPVPFRWTGPEATISVPLEEAETPRSVRIGIAGPPSSQARMRLTVNGCVLYEGAVESAPWYRTFSLDSCSDLHGANEAHIEIRTLLGTSGDSAGVALETLNLYEAPWPPPPAGPHDLRAAVTLVGSTHEKVAHMDPLVLDVQNRGSTAWAGTASHPDRASGIALEFRWRRLPSGPDDRSQRLQLPRVLQPADTVRVEIPLVPPAAVDGAGPWEVTIAPVTDTGVEIPVETRCTVRVRAAAPHASR
jgi:hypothetical protein